MVSELVCLCRRREIGPKLTHQWLLVRSINISQHHGYSYLPNKYCANCVNGNSRTEAINLYISIFDRTDAYETTAPGKPRATAPELCQHLHEKRSRWRHPEFSEEMRGVLVAGPSPTKPKQLQRLAQSNWIPDKQVEQRMCPYKLDGVWIRLILGLCAS